jgi:integrase/recombinase XerC
MDDAADVARSAASLGALAEEFVDARRRRRRDGDGVVDNSHEARIDDLVRFAVALRRTLELDADTLEPLCADGSSELESAFAGMDASQLDAATLVASVVELWQFEHQPGERYAQATVLRTVSTVRMWTRWMHRSGVLVDDPGADEQVTVTMRSYRDHVDGRVDAVGAFSTDDVAGLVSAAATPREGQRSAWPARDVAIIELLARCGPRVSEVCALQIRHVDKRPAVAQLRLRLGTKGGKPRDVPIPRSVVAQLDVYLAERQDRFGSPTATDPLFVRVSGSRVDRSFLDRLVRRVAAAGGVEIPADAACHGLRHFYGVQLAVRGVPLAVIQQLMGHADPRTTAVYTHMAGDLLSEQLLDAGWI